MEVSFFEFAIGFPGGYGVLSKIKKAHMVCCSLNFNGVMGAVGPQSTAGLTNIYDLVVLHMPTVGFFNGELAS